MTSADNANAAGQLSCPAAVLSRPHLSHPEDVLIPCEAAMSRGRLYLIVISPPLPDVDVTPPVGALSVSVLCRFARAGAAG